MKVNRSKLIQHLQRLLCGDQIKEAIFTGGFAATALTPDQMLLVIAPGLKKCPPIEDEIGIADVKGFVQKLAAFTGEGNTGVEVELEFQDGRLHIDDDERAHQSIIIAAPKTIATRVEDGVVKKLLAVKPDDEVNVTLSRIHVDGVRKAFGIYKSEQVQVHVTPKGATMQIGGENEDNVKVPLGDVDTKKSEYTLLFDRNLIDVFSVITDYSSATLRLGGPRKPAVVTDGNYQYIISPRAQSADAKKAATKESAKAATKGKGKKGKVVETEPEKDDEE